MGVFIKKTPNFDAFFDGRGVKSSLSKALREYGEIAVENSKKKYVPVVSGKLYKSVKYKQQSTTLTLKSIDYRYTSELTRYNLKTSKNPRNRKKYEWFDRTIKDTEKIRKKLLTGVITEYV